MKRLSSLVLPVVAAAALSAAVGGCGYVHDEATDAAVEVVVDKVPEMSVDAIQSAMRDDAELRTRMIDLLLRSPEGQVAIGDAANAALDRRQIEAAQRQAEIERGAAAAAAAAKAEVQDTGVLVAGGLAVLLALLIVGRVLVRVLSYSRRSKPSADS
jgi:hypothetical protein